MYSTNRHAIAALRKETGQAAPETEKELDGLQSGEYSGIRDKAQLYSRECSRRTKPL